jgi:hypothetical protein
MSTATTATPVRREPELLGQSVVVIGGSAGIGLEIQEYTDPDNDPMIPHTLVLKPGLVVHKIYNGYWFWGRPSVVDLWHDLREVSAEIRPDWDLGAPWLREAWEARDASAFHGWSKRGLAGVGGP